MGRNITTTPSTGSGASTPTSGTTYEGMPVMGDISNGKSINVINLSNVYSKTASATLQRRSNIPFFSAAFNTTLGKGAYITNATAANTWYTVFSTSGTKGKLFHVIPQVPTAASTLDIEITIDGVVHTYTVSAPAANYCVVLGLLLPHYPKTSSPITSDDIYNPSGYTDVGFQLTGSNVYYLPDPTMMLAMGSDLYLQWTTDMQVRVRSTSSTNTTSVYPYAGVSYVLD